MTESITLLEENILKTEKNSLSIQFKPESYDTQEMESMNQVDNTNETTDQLKSGKIVKASDQTCREATNQKTGEVSADKFGACTGQTGNSINASSKTAVINKNATLRTSKSSSEMTTTKQEPVKHSMSFCGNSNNSSNYSSIPESHGDNADQEQQVPQQQSYQKHLPKKQQSQQFTNNQKQTEKQGEFQTHMQTFKTSSTTAVIPNDSAITSTKTAVTSTDSAITSTKTAVTSTDTAITSTKTAVTSTDSATTSTKTAVTSTDNVITLTTKSVTPRENAIISTTAATIRDSTITSTTAAVIPRDNAITSSTTAVITRDNVITSTTAAVTPRNNAITSTTTAVTPRDNVKTSSTTVVTPRDNVITSTTTAITQRGNVITSTAIAGTSITAVTSHQQPLTLNLKQVSPADSKGSSQVYSPFSPPSAITSNCSNWLSQKWQGTDVEQFHGGSVSEGQLKAEERKSNISVDRLSYETPPEEKVLTSSRGTEAYNSAHKPWSSKKSSFTTAPPERAESASTMDCKYGKQQPTSLDFTMNDLGSREAPTSIEMSVIQNSSLSSQSQDYVSIPIPSSMESSTLLSQSFVSSMESSASSLSLSETTQTSVPTAVYSPTCTCTFLKKEKRKDFILLYSDADQDEAERYRDHLENEIGIPDITVDLFGDIDSGKSAMTTLETLHDRYNNILVFRTINSADDKFSRFLTENILITGLKEANGKEYRVIPVWASSDCKKRISEVQNINGFEYFFFLSDSTSRRANSYIKCVRSTVEKERKNSDNF